MRFLHAVIRRSLPLMEGSQLSHLSLVLSHLANNPSTLHDLLLEASRCHPGDPLNAKTSQLLALPGAAVTSASPAGNFVPGMGPQSPRNPNSPRNASQGQLVWNPNSAQGFQGNPSSSPSPHMANSGVVHPGITHTMSTHVVDPPLGAALVGTDYPPDSGNTGIDSTLPSYYVLNSYPPSGILHPAAGISLSGSLPFVVQQGMQQSQALTPALEAHCTDFNAAGLRPLSDAKAGTRPPLDSGTTGIFTTHSLRNNSYLVPAGSSHVLQDHVVHDANGGTPSAPAVQPAGGVNQTYGKGRLASSSQGDHGDVLARGQSANPIIKDNND